MKLKLIVALVGDEKRERVVEAARAAGATGATVINSVRGEGLEPGKTFLGLDLATANSLLLFLVAEERARVILEGIRDAAGLDDERGAGVAFQLAIEDAVGLATQLPVIQREAEEAL